MLPTFLGLLAVRSALQAQQPAVSGATGTMSSDAAAERIENIDTLKGQLKQYHDCTCACGCYTRDIDRQADNAIAFLRRRAKNIRPAEKLAIVLDIDETTLSNYPELIDADFANNAKVFDAWVMSSRGQAIGGTARLYKEAQRLGVTIFFITGRSEAERTVTERNLREQGFEGWDRLYMRPPDGPKQTTSEYKSSRRRQIVDQGFVLVLNVGDQWSDLRGAPQAELNVKYPDPFYLIP
jgi:acid phosphatase